MRRRITTLLGLAVTSSAVILWLAAASIVSAGDPCYHDFAMPSPTIAPGSDVTLMPCAFTPTITQVATGTTVTFHNTSEFRHLVTGANQSWGSRDVEIQPGASVSYTFDAPGIYPYSCALHRGMSGAIVVATVGDSSAGGTTGGAAVGPQEGGPNTGGTMSSRAVAAAPASAGMDGPILAAVGASAALIVGLALLVGLRSRRPDNAGAGSGTV